MRPNQALFERATAFSTLIDSAHLAARGKRHRPEVADFLWNLEPEVLRLEEELRSGSYTPGTLYQFTIHDPKERVISVAPFRDRVVHHALCSVLVPLLERRAIGNSFACRVNRGTHRAVECCRKYVRRGGFFLKCDIRHFFPSVDLEINQRLLRSVCGDVRLLEVFDRILNAAAVRTNGRSRNLPIGNLTSQHLANFYLTGLDHFVLQELKPRGYLRYMDDFLLFDAARANLRGMLRELRSWLLRERRLELKEAATLLTACAHGIPFLGLRVFPGVLRLRRARVRRFRDRTKQRLGQLLREEITEEAAQSSLGSIVAHTVQAAGPSFRRSVLGPDWSG